MRIGNAFFEETRMPLSLLNITSNFPHPRVPFAGGLLPAQTSWLAGKGYTVRTIHPIPVLSRHICRVPRQDFVGDSETFRPRYAWAPPRLARSLKWCQSTNFTKAVLRTIGSRFPFPAITLVNWLFPGGEAAYRLWRQHNIPYILIGHGQDIRSLTAQWSRYSVLYREVLVNAKQILTYGTELATLLTDATDIKGLRVEPFDFGTPISMFKPSPILRPTIKQKFQIPAGLKIILFVGRFEEPKGSRDLASLIPQFLEKHLDWGFVCAGPVIDKDSKERMEAIGRTWFLGTVSPQNMPEVFQMSDAFILLSYYEGQPNSVKEALASGLPVISYDAGGIRALVGGSERGYIVPIGEQEGVLNALDSLTENDIPELSVKCRDYAERHLDFDIRMNEFKTMIDLACKR